MERNESIIAELAEPVIILSDIHLHSRSKWKAQVEMLRSLWANAGTIIFNGDTLNWRLDREDNLREEVKTSLAEICRQDGAEPIFLTGNADIRLSSQDVMLLCKGKVFVSHGHLFFPNISPWAKHSKIMLQERNRVMRDQTEEFRNTLSGQCAATRKAIMIMQQRHLERLRNKPIRREFFHIMYTIRRIFIAGTILRAWRNLIPLATQFTENYASEARFLVMGHTHKPGIWHRDGKVIINTGSPGGSLGARVVRIENDTLTVQAIKKSAGQYTAGKTIAQFQV